MVKKDIMLDIIDDLNDNGIVYEDDFRKIMKVIGDVKVSKNFSKRITETVWKKSNSDVPSIDIRNYNIKKNKYYRGISMSKLEAKELYEILKKYFE